MGRLSAGRVAARCAGGPRRRRRPPAGTPARSRIRGGPLLTHNGNESYEEYIDRLADAVGDAGVLARAVKEADMLDDLRRCVLARDPAVGQYGRALAKLWNGSDPKVARADPTHEMRTLE